MQVPQGFNADAAAGPHPHGDRLARGGQGPGGPAHQRTHKQSSSSQTTSRVIHHTLFQRKGHRGDRGAWEEGRSKSVRSREHNPSRGACLKSTAFNKSRNMTSHGEAWRCQDGGRKSRARGAGVAGTSRRRRGVSPPRPPCEHPCISNPSSPHPILTPHTAPSIAPTRWATARPRVAWAAGSQWMPSTGLLSMSAPASKKPTPLSLAMAA